MEVADQFVELDQAATAQTDGCDELKHSGGKQRLQVCGGVVAAGRSFHCGAILFIAGQKTKRPQAQAAPHTRTQRDGERDGVCGVNNTTVLGRSDKTRCTIWLVVAGDGLSAPQTGYRRSETHGEEGVGEG